MAFGFTLGKKFRITFDYYAHGRTYSGEFQSDVAVPQNEHIPLAYNPLEPAQNTYAPEAEKASSGRQTAACVWRHWIGRALTCLAAGFARLQLEPEFAGSLLECFQTDRDMLFHRHPKQLSTLRDIFALHGAGEAFVLHLLDNALHLHLRNALGRLDQRAGSQEAGELVAGEEGMRSRCVSGFTPE